MTVILDKEGILKLFRFAVKYTVFLCLFIILAVLLFYTMVRIGIFGRIPSFAELKEIKNYTASEVYSADGVLLGKYFIENRTEVSFQAISHHLIHALIATEDARFFHHKGVDKRSLLRVLIRTVIMGDRSAGGGSTIQQQLSKNIFPRKRYGFLTFPVNKIKETIIAYRLEKVYTKQEILTLYLNTVSFGEDVYGIEVASERFFSISPALLNLSQSSVLVGMLKSPTYYNPRLFPERSLQRRNTVFDRLVTAGYIDYATADSLKALPLDLHYKNLSHSEGAAPYFREQLRKELDVWLKKHPAKDGKKYNLYTDGLKIYTSIHSKIQKYAEEAVLEHMTVLQKRFNNQWGNSPPWNKNKELVRRALQRSPRYKKLKDEGYSEKEINEIVNTPVPVTLFDYRGEKQKKISPLDSIKYYMNFLNAGFLATDVKTGYVLAWVGGINHSYFQYDHVMSKRQTGSTFKPVVYSAALEKGLDPCEYYKNKKIVYSEYEDWSPRNADDEYKGYYTLQGGLTYSVNTVSVQVILQTGIQNVIRMAKKLGIQSVLPAVPSLALGTADVSLLEMVRAYSVFPNRGDLVYSSFLLRIENSNGNVLYDFSSPVEQRHVLSARSADIMVHFLKSVAEQGTAKSLRDVYRLSVPVAGKTGTTQSCSDGWFIGFTPELVAGVWVGAEDPEIHFRSMALGQGSATALPIWAGFMKKIYNDRSLLFNPDESFYTLSDDIVKQLDCELYSYMKPGGFMDLFFGSKKKNEIKKDPAVKETWIDRIFKKRKK